MRVNSVLAVLAGVNVVLDLALIALDVPQAWPALHGLAGWGAAFCTAMGARYAERGI